MSDFESFPGDPRDLTISHDGDLPEHSSVESDLSGWTPSASDLAAMIDDARYAPITHGYTDADLADSLLIKAAETEVGSTFVTQGLLERTVAGFEHDLTASERTYEFIEAVAHRAGIADSIGDIEPGQVDVLKGAVARLHGASFSDFELRELYPEDRIGLAASFFGELVVDESVAVV